VPGALSVSLVQWNNIGVSNMAIPGKAVGPSIGGPHHCPGPVGSGPGDPSGIDAPDHIPTAKTKPKRSSPIRTDIHRASLIYTPDGTQKIELLQSSCQIECALALQRRVTSLTDAYNAHAQCDAYPASTGSRSLHVHCAFTHFSVYVSTLMS